MYGFTVLSLVPRSTRSLLLTSEPYPRKDLSHAFRLPELWLLEIRIRLLSGFLLACFVSVSLFSFCWWGHSTYRSLSFIKFFVPSSSDPSLRSIFSSFQFWFTGILKRFNYVWDYSLLSHLTISISGLMAYTSLLSYLSHGCAESYPIFRVLYSSVTSPGTSGTFC